MIQDLASLLWVVNLGCIDLNPWYARCDDVDRPDYLHFDLDPVPEATYAAVVETAQLVHAALKALGMPPIVKTTGSRGLHVYVPIVRGPTQKEVWTLRQALRLRRSPRCGPTSSPPSTGSRSGRPGASSSTTTRTPGAGPSPRRTRRDRGPVATVSAPIGWDELEAGARIEDFDLRNMPARIARVGDLWAPLLAASGRFDLATLMR